MLPRSPSFLYNMPRASSPSARRWCARASATALSGYQCNSPVALYRDTALLRPPYGGRSPCCKTIVTAIYRDTALFRPLCGGREGPHLYCIAILTALYRDTALFRPPCGGREGPQLYCKAILTALYRDNALGRDPYYTTSDFDRLLLALFRPPYGGRDPYCFAKLQKSDR